MAYYFKKIASFSTIMNVSFKNLKTSVLLISLLVLASCEFSFSTGSGGASKENDIAKKTTIKKNELDFKELSISGGSNKEKTTEFIYGEKIEFEFSDLKGLTEENNLVYPGLQVLVLGNDKDTIVYNEDLYEGKTEGIKNSNVKLSAWMTLGDPIHSKSQYEILLHIWDKKGEGTIDTSLKVDVIPNNKIDVKNSDFLCIGSCCYF